MADEVVTELTPQEMVDWANAALDREREQQEEIERLQERISHLEDQPGRAHMDDVQKRTIDPLRAEVERLRKRNALLEEVAVAAGPMRWTAHPLTSSEKQYVADYDAAADKLREAVE